MATLKDISRELGISVTTVSRALNGYPEVGAKTRKLVKETAERMGYRPNRTAQRLVTGRSGMVGIIDPMHGKEDGDQTFFEVLTGLAGALAEADTDLVLAVDQGDDPVEPYRRMLERDILDGFIINAPVPGDARIAFLQDQKVPFVVHGQTETDVDYPYYGIDNAAVTADAVELLVTLGHGRIAMLNGPAQLAFARDRRLGFETAMAAAGLPVPAFAVVDETEGAADGYLAALSLLSGRAGAVPTALICATTKLANGAYRAAKDTGLRIPEDLSIIAHDDARPEYRAVEFSPALTVTRAPLRDASAPLAKALVAVVRGADPKELQTQRRATLIARDSTGPIAEQEKGMW